jgi:phage tail-like protein
VAEPALLRTFRFQVKLRQSAGGGAGGISASASIGASFSASASASAGAAGIAASASLTAGIGVGVGIGSATGDQLGDGGFQECSGLEISMDVQELIEGGRNDGVVRRIGHGKYGNIVLKRGLFYPANGTVNAELWAWLQRILSGTRPVARYDGIIEVMTASGDAVAATWVFDRGLPAKISGPQLNARTGEVAVEELTIAHEGLRLRI